VARRSGLGRGLGALIPSDLTTPDDATLRDLAVSQVEPNGHQPREHFDEESLVSLTDSIREVGVLQPVLVRPAGQDRFELIAGERRWRAAKRAGLQTIPAIIRHIDDAASLEQAVVENLHRQDLSPLEEAAAYQQLIEDFELSHEDVARRVGKSRSAVTNTVRLLQLPANIQRLVADGQLTAGHARALLGTPDRAYQDALARRAVAEKLTVREVEDAVRARSAPDAEEPAANVEEASSPSQPHAARGLRPPGLLELESLLSDRLDTRVKVSMGAKRGKVTIDFATLEDLERIYRAMTTPT
jgi:ParB family chromosome partitioning protein